MSNPTSPITPTAPLNLASPSNPAPINPASPTTRPSCPSLRRPDTGCVVRLSQSLVPVSITHTDRCKCMGVRTDDEIDQLAETVTRALREGVFECEKPTLAFAMILLGGEVVYDDSVSRRVPKGSEEKASDAKESEAKESEAKESDAK